MFNLNTSTTLAMMIPECFPITFRYFRWLNHLPFFADKLVFHQPKTHCLTIASSSGAPCSSNRLTSMVTCVRSGSWGQHGTFIKQTLKTWKNIQSPTVSSGKCRCLVIFSVIFSGPIQQSGDCHITLCPPATPRGDGHMASVRCQGKGKPWRTGKHRLLQMIYPLKLVIFHSYISLPESDYHNYLLTQH